VTVEEQRGMCSGSDSAIQDKEDILGDRERGSRKAAAHADRRRSSADVLLVHHSRYIGGKVARGQGRGLVSEVAGVE
jgi:hypothetical protein